MVKRLIYLSEKEDRDLTSLARRLDKPEKELIRSAVRHMLIKTGSADRKRALEKAFGIWKNRTADEFKAVRKSFNRLATRTHQ